ncbi:MAG: response regulator [Rhodospirillales bacterium]|nr:response regulator [Rhodospirillales bacterium]
MLQWFRSLLSVSLRHQLMMGIALIHTVMMSVFVLHLVERQRQFLHLEQVANTLSLIQGVARNSTSWVLAGDVIGLQEVVQAFADYPEMRYAFVMDLDGKVLAHTDHGLIGKYVADPVGLALSAAAPQPRLLIDDDRLIDAAAPILEDGRPVGWARAGISQDKTRQSLAAVTREGVLYTLGAIVIGAAFALWMSRGLTRGLYGLLEVAEATRAGQRGRRADSRRPDEIGRLASAFNRMLDALAQGESELKDLNQDLERRVEERTDRLRDSEEKHRLLLENLPHRIFFKDRDSVYLAVNPPFAALFGRSSVELVGRGDGDFQEAERAAYVRRLDQRVMSSGRHLEFDEAFVIDGERRTYHTMKAPVRDADGRIIGLLGISWDIIDRKLAEDALAEASRTADAANRAKSDFLANMSHEIRTPMNAVIGLAHLLSQTPLDGRQRDYLSKIQVSAQSLLALLNDILDLSKVEAGKLELEARPFRLDQQLRDLATILSTNARHKDIEVLFKVDSAVPTELVGDTLRLQQILINLAGNAIKFTQNGEVLVSVALVSLRDERATLRFSIRDSGIGITPEQRQRLFTAFNQGDSSTSRRFGGSGLGLAISSRLVRMMDGEIDVVSEPGQGSEFFFTATFGLSARAPCRPEAALNMLRGLKVLVVDDNPTALHVTESMVTGLGWHADLAASGEEAMDFYSRASSPYDLVLMDWKMPGMDGLQTSRRIRQTDREGQPPIIIVVTAYGREEVMRNASDEVNALLVKPMTASMLLDTVGGLYRGEDRQNAVTRPAASAIPLAGLRLLVAEDNAINQQVAYEMLTQAGAMVRLAGNGAEAVAMLEHGEVFDAVLMDVQMPEMDGYQATRALRALPGLGELPIIAMTANAMASDRDLCLTSGMNDHMAKPLDPEAMVRVILRWTRGCAAAADMPAPSQPVTLAAPELPGIDFTQALARLGGRQETLRKLLRGFRVRAAESLEACQAALTADDADGLAATAHALKGMAGNMSAVTIQDAADRIETAARAGRSEDWAALVEGLRDAVEPVCRGIDAAAAGWGDIVAESIGAAIPANLSERIDALRRMLHDQDFAATETYEAMRAGLEAAFGPDAVAPLGRAMENLDFSGASLLLMGMAGRRD